LCKDFDTAVPLLKILGNGKRTVCRAVIDNQNIQVAPSLIHDGG
jgi:hypothetical protein